MITAFDKPYFITALFAPTRLLASQATPITPLQMRATPSHLPSESASPITGPLTSDTSSGAVPRINGYAWPKSPARNAAARSL
jgi:hypothetical protein